MHAFFLDPAPLRNRPALHVQNVQADEDTTSCCSMMLLACERRGPSHPLQVRVLCRLTIRTLHARSRTGGASTSQAARAVDACNSLGDPSIAAVVGRVATTATEPCIAWLCVYSILLRFSSYLCSLRVLTTGQLRIMQNRNMHLQLISRNATWSRCLPENIYSQTLASNHSVPNSLLCPCHRSACKHEEQVHKQCAERPSAAWMQLRKSMEVVKDASSWATMSSVGTSSRDARQVCSACRVRGEPNTVRVCPSA